MHNFTTLNFSSYVEKFLNSLTESQEKFPFWGLRNKNTLDVCIADDKGGSQVPICGGRTLLWRMCHSFRVYFSKIHCLIMIN